MLFGLLFSVFVGIVFYAGLTDNGVAHQVAIAISLGVAVIGSFVFHAYMVWEGLGNTRQYHSRKLGQKRRR